MIHQLRKSMFAALTAVTIVHVSASTVAGDPTRNSSALLPMVLAENAVAERRIVRRLLAGENPGSPAMREEAHNLRLLQADLLVLGYTGDLPAMEVPSEKDVAVRVLIHRVGLDGVDPWSILAGRTLSFQRSQE